VPFDAFRQRRPEARHRRRNLGDGEVPDAPYRAEGLEECRATPFAHALDLQQRRVRDAALPQGPVIGVGETVGLVTDRLEQT